MMKVFTRIFALVLLLAVMDFAYAQDKHFSQFYAAPLELNPAMTGNINGAYRGSVIYRNQYASIPAPYSTVAASFDAAVLRCKLGNSHLGAGLSLYNDRAGDAVYNTTAVSGSLAYHLGIGDAFGISLGGQAGFIQKGLNTDALLFESQINEQFELDPTLPSMEMFANEQFNYIDYSAGGLVTASPSQNINFYLGGAYIHAGQPGEAFLDESNLAAPERNKLDPRLVFHGGGSVFFNDQFSISPSVIYQSQAGAQEVVAGAALGYHFDQGGRYRGAPSSGIYVGGWYRLSGEIIALVGVDYQDFRFGFTYDVTVSDLAVANLNQGAVELSLTWIGAGPECQKKTNLYCPRF
ncbi:MAG: PorP/SprF family type IX secretion system membrane protein [Chitinophagales bacterium]